MCLYTCMRVCVYERVHRTSCFFFCSAPRRGSAGEYRSKTRRHTGVPVCCLSQIGDSTQRGRLCIDMCAHRQANRYMMHAMKCCGGQWIILSNLRPILLLLMAARISHTGGTNETDVVDITGIHGSHNIADGNNLKISTTIELIDDCICTHTASLCLSDGRTLYK